jgi:hypothetical protein
MEDALHSLGRPQSCLRISNVAFNDLEPWIAVVLCQIGPAADNKIVEDPNAPALIDEPVDKMAADKSGAASNEVQAKRFSHVRLPAVTSIVANHHFESWLYGFRRVNCKRRRDYTGHLRVTTWIGTAIGSAFEALFFGNSQAAKKIEDGMT